MGQNTQEKNFIGPKQEYDDEPLLKLVREEPGTFFVGVAAWVFENPFICLVLMPYYLISIGILEAASFVVEAPGNVKKLFGTSDSGQASESDLQKFEELRENVTEAAGNFMDPAAIIQEQGGGLSVEALGDFYIPKEGH